MQLIWSSSKLSMSGFWVRTQRRSAHLCHRQPQQKNENQKMGFEGGKFSAKTVFSRLTIFLSVRSKPFRSRTCFLISRLEISKLDRKPAQALVNVFSRTMVFKSFFTSHRYHRTRVASLTWETDSLF